MNNNVLQILTQIALFKNKYTFQWKIISEYDEIEVYQCILPITSQKCCTVFTNVN